MEIRELDVNMVKEIYNTFMTVDFPQNELKSLKKIVRCTEEGNYVSYGFYENDELIGYAYCIRVDKTIMLDYFAILEEKRLGGYGSKALQLISDYLKNDFDTFILEAEDPKHYLDEEDKIRREKRLQFYLKNNCKIADFTANVYTVEFVIFRVFDNINDDENLIENYQKIYISISNVMQCEKNVKIFRN